MRTKIGMALMIAVVVLLATAFGLSAERKVLAELITSTTCGPCAGANPYFDNWLAYYEHRARVSVIKYHVWWPQPGDDPFYESNPTQNAARNSYYGNNFAPHMFIDGAINGGSSAGSWPDLIEGSLAQVSPFIIRISGNLTMDGGTIRIKVISDGTAIPAGSLTLQVALIESDLRYTGSNGDPIHHFVMQKMLPGSSGEAFTVALNDSVEFTRTIDPNYYWFFENGGVVAFIQQNGTKAVLQSEMRTMASLFPPAPTVLISPMDHAVDQPAQTGFVWQKDMTAFRYRLQVAPDSAFSTIVAEDSTIIDTTYHVPPLEGGTLYYWRVRSGSENGWGAYSSARKFTTITPPPAPNLAFPPEAAVDQRVRVVFRWDPSSTAERYRIQVALDSLFTNVVLNVADLPQPLYSTGPLEGLTQYYWRAAGGNTGGWGGWSSVFSFMTEEALTVTFATVDRWNMVSVPVDVGQIEPGALFTGTTSAAYAFIPTSGYSLSTIVGHGGGYWLKFGSAQTISINGSPLDQETLAVQTGWNIIGSISSIVPTTSIVTEPSGLLSGLWYGYAGGYYPSASIEPGRAYWVKADENGSVILRSPAGRSDDIISHNAYESLGRMSRLTIRDAAGSSQQLYLQSDAPAYSPDISFELPPNAPAGTFDSRFTGNQMVFAPSSAQSRCPVEISDAVYPVTLTWNMRGTKSSWWLSIDGNEIPLSGDGSISIEKQGAGIAVRLSDLSSRPGAFALSQNYPNPFNPMTTIRYDVPVDAKVTVKVFDVLGREVATLVDEVQEAGYKSTSWNALATQGSQLASGTYFYRLDAADLNDINNRFTEVRRMFLIK